jgi:broad specificity phosphatase PhoE
MFYSHESIAKTASLLFPDKHIDICASDLLLEYNTGIACNCRHELTHQKELFPQIDFETYFVPPLSIETTWDHGAQRAAQMLNMLHQVKVKGYACIGVVSHGNFIRNIMAQLNQTNDDELTNCGAHIFTI